MTGPNERLTAEYRLTVVRGLALVGLLGFVGLVMLAVAVLA